jgi:NAD(P)-dependent dehydrogenase (short-subunit alcohol dehydrogenase family)
MTDFGSRTCVPPRALPFRLLGSIWRQKARCVRCPDAPRLDGKLAVVTGGNAGIGVEIVRGLAERGAEVILAARTAATAEAARAAISKETGAKLHVVPLDLTDLALVRAASDAIAKIAGARRIDILVNNAGVWPQAHATTKQGHELAFGVNLLAHHVLVRRLVDAKALRAGSRVVVVTGDIYIRARECTSDFTYTGTSAGALAYARSKLGNLWFAFELQRRQPDLEVVVVHPGVVASNLGGQAPPAFVRNVMMIALEEGAQAPLFCATQPIEKGAYYHNALGRMLLRAPDPAADPEAAKGLWARLDELAAAFV